MNHDVQGLVQMLNEIAERKQPGQRAERSFQAFTLDMQDGASFTRPRPDAPVDTHAIGPHTSADCQPSTLCA